MPGKNYFSAARPALSRARLSMAIRVDPRLKGFQHKKNVTVWRDAYRQPRTRCWRTIRPSTAPSRTQPRRRQLEAFVFAPRAVADLNDRFRQLDCRDRDYALLRRPQSYEACSRLLTMQDVRGTRIPPTYAMTSP